MATRKRPGLAASVGESLSRKKLRRADGGRRGSGVNGDDDDADDEPAGGSSHTAAELAVMRSPRFTASQATSHTQREAGIIEEIQLVNFMNHNKLSFQYVSYVGVASLVRNVCCLVIFLRVTNSVKCCHCCSSLIALLCLFPTVGA